MRLFTPFTIPKKDNYDLCRIKTKKRKADNPFLDNLFRNLYVFVDSDHGFKAQKPSSIDLNKVN